MPAVIDMNDARLREPSTGNDGTGARGCLRRGAHLLRSRRFVEALRAGEQFRLPPEDPFNGFRGHARCDCGGPVEWNAPGLAWPVCEKCMAGAVESLAAVDGDGPEAA